MNNNKNGTNNVNGTNITANGTMDAAAELLCAIEQQVVLNIFVQLSRALLLAFHLLVLVQFVCLCRKYRQCRLALHPNLRVRFVVENGGIFRIPVDPMFL